MSEIAEIKYMRELRRGMADHFDVDGLQALTFDLGVDWGELTGEKKSTKSRSLIVHLAHRGRLGDLITLLQEERPNVDWPTIPSSEQQIKDEFSIIPDSVHEAALQNFLDKMNLHVVPHKLKSATVSYMSHQFPYEMETVGAAKAYIGTVISRLDKTRLSLVIRFLGDIALAPLVVLDSGDLSGTDLSHADLSRVNLRKANLSGADLSGAKLIQANLSGANLFRAKLRNAKMHATNLYDADLIEADLSEADLREAEVGGANLSGVNLLGANVDWASYNSFTVWPDGFDPWKYPRLRLRDYFDARP